MALLPCRIAAIVARNASVSALIWLIGLPLPLFQEIFTCFNRRRLSVPLPCSEHDGASFGRRAGTTPFDLSDREREVLVLLAQGLSNREIAGRLSITEGTVKNHVLNILARLQAENRTQVVNIARREGLMD